MKKQGKILLILIIASFIVIAIADTGAWRFVVSGYAAPVNTMEASMLDAQAALLMERSTGKVLFDKEGDRRMYPASTTKILTALLAMENGDLDERVTVGDALKYRQKDGSAADLEKGMRLSLADLIRGMMLPSGNDAAYVIAVHIGTKVQNRSNVTTEEALQEFVALMNTRAAELGAKATHFANPDGYPDPDHYSTARDLAVITREAMKNSFFCAVVNTDKYVPPMPKGAKQPIQWTNKNELINPKSKYYYRYATGLKTGHSSDAGYCLVSSGSREGMNVIAVVLKSTETGRWNDSVQLLEYGLTQYRVYPLVRKGEVVAQAQAKGILPGKTVRIDVQSREQHEEVLTGKEMARLQKTLQWDVQRVEQHTDGSIWMKPGVAAGQSLGMIQFQLDGRVIAQTGMAAVRGAMGMNTVYIVLLVIIGPLGVFALAVAMRHPKKRRRLVRKRANTVNKEEYP